MVIISIEGNIGSGKSTLLDVLTQLSFDKPHIVIQEDVKDWVSITDNQNTSILEYFYQDKASFGFTFQTLVVLSRIKHILDTVKQNPDHIILTERTHLTDFQIFVKSLYENNIMDEISYLTYSKCHHMLHELLNLKIDGIIYNYASPQTCLDRIKKRNRKGESNIKSEYILELHDRHNDWLIKQDNLLVIDGDVDENDVTTRNKQIDKIVAFVNKIC